MKFARIFALILTLTAAVSATFWYVPKPVNRPKSQDVVSPGAGKTYGAGSTVDTRCINVYAPPIQIKIFAGPGPDEMRPLDNKVYEVNSGDNGQFRMNIPKTFLTDDDLLLELRINYQGNDKNYIQRFNAKGEAAANAGRKGEATNAGRKEETANAGRKEQTVYGGRKGVFQRKHVLYGRGAY